MRPQVFQVGGTLYWVIQTRNPDTMVLKDADSTPTVAVRKNGASVGDSVTITKRSATTGIYDCSYNPAGEVEGDAFTLEESATVTGTTTAQATYTQTWNCRVIAVERGTDSANTTAPDNAGIAAIKAKTDNLPSDPADQSLLMDAIANVQTSADAALRPTTAGRTLDVDANGAVELDSATINAIRDGIPKVGETHRYTQVASAATTTDVSIGEAV